MMNQSSNNNVSSTSLETVAHQFKHWRTTRGKRGRIPGVLWALVTPLMDQYSPEEIASALGLNHAKLKERVLPFASQTTCSPVTFVEYPLPSPISKVESCVIEFTGKNGSAVKISGLTAMQVQPLVSIPIFTSRSTTN